MPKISVAYRLSPESLKRIEALCAKLELSKTAVLERALRELARREKVNAAE